MTFTLFVPLWAILAVAGLACYLLGVVTPATVAAIARRVQAARKALAKRKAKPGPLPMPKPRKVTQDA